MINQFDPFSKGKERPLSQFSCSTHLEAQTSQSLLRLTMGRTDVYHLSLGCDPWRPSPSNTQALDWHISIFVFYFWFIIYSCWFISYPGLPTNPAIQSAKCYRCVTGALRAVIVYNENLQGAVLNLSTLSSWWKASMQARQEKLAKLLHGADTWLSLSLFYWREQR